MRSKALRAGAVDDPLPDSVVSSAGPTVELDPTQQECAAVPASRSSRPGARIAALDSVRGAAVLLMVVDHVLVVTEGGGWSVGRFLTRLSLPAFALVLGAVAVRPLSWRRWWSWAAAAGAAQVLYPLAGITGPLLLVWLALGRFAAVRLSRRAALGLLGVLLVVLVNGLPVPGPPGEYSPVFVVGLVVLGRQLGPAAVVGWARYVPAFCGAVGRRPLLWYLGHLAALAGLGAVLGAV